MKKLLTLLAIAFTFQCVAQDLDSMVFGETNLVKYTEWCNEAVPDTLRFVKDGVNYKSVNTGAIMPYNTKFDSIFTVSDSIYGNFTFYDIHTEKRRCLPTFNGFIEWLKNTTTVILPIEE